MPGNELVADLVGLGEPDPRFALAPVDKRDPFAVQQRAKDPLESRRFPCGDVIGKAGDVDDLSDIRSPSDLSGRSRDDADNAGLLECRLGESEDLALGKAERDVVVQGFSPFSSCMYSRAIFCCSGVRSPMVRSAAPTTEPGVALAAASKCPARRSSSWRSRP